MAQPVARPRSVLFVCSRNAVRSPMAGAIARMHFGESIVVESAGIEAGEIDPFAVVVMRELDIDIARYRPKILDHLSQASFDLIITLSPEAHHRALEVTRQGSVAVEYWPLQDPTLAVELGLSREAILQAYRAVRDILLSRVISRLSGEPSPPGEA